MRTILTIILATISLVAIQAQDIIVKNGGDTLKVYDLKVGTKFITYRLTPDEKPARRISKSKVRSIKNNKKDTITYIVDHVAENDATITITEKEEKQHGEIQRPASINNSLIINRYNIRHDNYNNKRESNTTANCAVAIMAVADSSILANEDIEIEITPDRKSQSLQAEYLVYIHNKSDRNIHIDFENCFRIYNNGSFKTFYNAKEIRQSRKSNESLTLTEYRKNPQYPGMKYKNKERARSIRHNSSNSTNTSQRIVKEKKTATIPPGGKLPLPANISLDENNELVKRGERFGFMFDRNINKWQTISFTESSTPYRSSFTIRYSYDKKFATYSIVKFAIYAKEIIGINRKGFKASKIYNFDNHTIYSEVNIKLNK